MPTCHLVLLALSGCLVQPIVPDTDAEPTPSTPDDTGKPEVDELRLSLTDAEPADGATELAQDAAITLTFDGVLDRAASPSDAVLVSVNDAPAAASIAWREDQLAITPEIRWPLFGEVVVRLDRDLVGEDDRSLEEPRALRFRVRDGAWTEVPTELQSSGSEWTEFSASRSGAAVVPNVHEVGTEQWLEPVVYDPSSQAFTPRPAMELLLRTTRIRAATEDGGAGIIAYTDWTASAFGDELYQALFFVRVDPDGAKVEPRRIAVETSNHAVTVGTTGTVSVAFELPGGAPDPRLVAWCWTLGDYEATADICLNQPAPDHEMVGLAAAGEHPILLTWSDGSLTAWRLGLGGPGSAPVRLFEGFRPDFRRTRSTGDGGISFTWRTSDGLLRNARYLPGEGRWDVIELGQDGLSGNGELCASASGTVIAAYARDGDLLVRDGLPGDTLSEERDVGDDPDGTAEVARCLLDDAGNGHVFYTGFGGGNVRWVRYRDGAWQEEQTLPIANWGFRDVTLDAYGTVNLFHEEQATGALQVFRFE